MSPLPRTCKCVLQRELKASRLNLRLLSISHVDHVIRKVFRCEKRNEKGQGPSGDEGRGYEPRHAGELNTETVQRGGSPLPELPDDSSLLTPWPEHCDTYSRLFPDCARRKN